ncbi:MAG: Na/Pi cotransporter family protein [Actinomycetia bacterium]|nr:Na/Pi cotransporter family protein [Actinomycetes bacterium]
MFTLFAAADVAIETTEDIKWTALIFGLLGGLALFLIGMERMTDSLRLIVGDRARGVLDKLTSNRFIGLITGAVATAIVQSSSVTTVLLVGFISAGLMTFVQSIPVILGSNIGSTVTAQIIAFNIATWALAFIAGGFVVSTVAKRESRRVQGVAVAGLGLMFFGMVVMGEAMSPLRTYEPFIDAMETLDNPIIAILVGAAFTAFVQSSAATTGVVIVLASQGLITLDAGIGLILGANIGTSVTALLAAIGKPRDAQRAAVAHLLFNVAGVMIWLPLIGVLGNGVSNIGGGLPREIANAHTLFNVANALIFLPFVNQFARFVDWLMPDKEQSGAIVPKYVDLGLRKTPGIALAKARMEMLRMARRVEGMLVDVFPAILDGDLDTLIEVRDRDDEVDVLHGLIIEYLGQISQEKLSPELSAELVDLFEATNTIEAIGDIVETNLVALGRQKMDESIDVSEETRELMQQYHKAVVEAFDYALIAVTQKDTDAAHSAKQMRSSIRRFGVDATDRQSQRLIVDEPNRVATYRFETDVMANLKLVYRLTRKIAKAAIPESGEPEA